MWGVGDGILSPVIRRSLPLLLGALILVSATVHRAAGAEETVHRVLRPGSATLELPDVTLRVPTYDTTVGPLILLQPIVDSLKGDFQPGPLHQRYTLTLGGLTCVFGPEGDAVTIDDQISSLSQAPSAGPKPVEVEIDDDEEEPMGPPQVALRHDLFVPIDLLQRTYGDLVGWEFLWDSETRTLRVSRKPPQEIPVTIEAIHLQGVTTLVLTFESQPNYRILRNEAGVEVEIAKDRLRTSPGRALPQGSLISKVRVDTDRIRITLTAGTEASDYTLQNPFRLVFDIHQSAKPKASSAGRSVSPPAREPGIRTIVIDPGHGGDETGAIGPSGVREKDLTLALAQLLRSRLRVRLPVRVVLTRDGDDTLPLDDRSALANQHKADLFISLHINSSYGRSAHGAETYFLSLEASDERAAEVAAAENQGAEEAPESDPGDPLFDLQLILWDLAQSHHLAESQRFAKLVQDELNLTLGLSNRGVKQAPLRVLRGAAMPAVLVELGFISNPGEEAKLQSLAYQSDLVDALVRAISRYKAQADRRGGDSGVGRQ